MAIRRIVIGVVAGTAIGAAAGYVPAILLAWSAAESPALSAWGTSSSRYGIVLCVTWAGLAVGSGVAGGAAARFAGRR